MLWACRAQGCFGYLAAVTAVGVGVMLGGLALTTRFGFGVSGVWLSLTAFHVVQSVATLFHHVRLGPLVQGAEPDEAPTESDLVAVECVDVPTVGEVCVTEELAAGGA